jgi:hypothetical protein
MRRSLVWLLAVLTLVAASCGGGDDNADTDDTDDTQAESASVDGEAPDNCTLITAEEASALAGYDLEAGEDSFLGCGFIPPGASVADITVNSALLDGDAASIAENGFPDAASIIDVGVGGDTVAVTTPSGDAVASVITVDNGRVVEVNVVFLGVDPDDMARIEEVAELAVTALGRWG